MSLLGPGVYSPPPAKNITNVVPDSTSGKVLRFVVKDYGRGVKWDDMPKIFHPFSQAGIETASVYGGTGKKWHG
jgi:signal transduction histidine kinase